MHFFQFVQVAAKALGFAVVLAVEVMQNHCLTAAEDADAYADYLMGLSQAGQLSEQKAMKKELDAAQRRLSELATLVQRIYEDNVFGRLSDDLYQTLSAKYEAETKELKTRPQKFKRCSPKQSPKRRAYRISPIWSLSMPILRSWMGNWSTR